MKTPTIGRQRELSLLEEFNKKDRTQLICIYGRRRIEKSFS